jgi:hypothetical protein
VGGRLRELNATHPGQGLENLGFKLASLGGGDGRRATEADYPAGEEGVCHGVGCEVRDRDDFWPAGEVVDYNEAVCVAC